MKTIASVLLLSGVILGTACGDDDTTGGSGATCAPEGSWEFKLTYSGTGACDAIAKAANAQPAAIHVFTKNADGTYTETEPGDADDTPTPTTLNASTCTLTGVEPGATASALTGTDGKKSPGKISSATNTMVVSSDGKTGTGSAKATVTADDSTVQGFPCDLSVSLAATKK